MDPNSLTIVITLVTINLFGHGFFFFFLRKNLDMVNHNFYWISTSRIQYMKIVVTVSKSVVKQVRPCFTESTVGIISINHVDLLS